MFLFLFLQEETVFWQKDSSGSKKESLQSGQNQSKKQIILSSLNVRLCKEVIEGLAKKLGYVSDGDKIVKINGLPFEQEKIYDAGTPIKAREPEYLPEWVGKVLGIAAFLTVCLYSLYQDIKSGLFKRRKNPVFMEGIPVYDLPQV